MTSQLRQIIQWEIVWYWISEPCFDIDTPLVQPWRSNRANFQNFQDFSPSDAIQFCPGTWMWNLPTFGILLNNYCNWKSLLTSYSSSNAFTLILNWYSSTSAAQNPNISGLSWNVRSWPRRKPKCRGTTSWLVSLSTCLVAAFKLNEANWTSETLIRMFNSISDVSD